MTVLNFCELLSNDELDILLWDSKSGSEAFHGMAKDIPWSLTDKKITGFDLVIETIWLNIK